MRILILCILLSACGGSGGGQGTSVAGEGDNVKKSAEIVFHGKDGDRVERY